MGSGTTITGRALLEMSGDYVGVWDYDDWINNYIRVSKDVRLGLIEAEKVDWSGMTFYIREAGSAKLSGPLHIASRPIDLKHPAAPGDCVKLWFRDETGSGPNDAVTYFCPSEGYEVPPMAVLESPLTLDAFKRYTEYYTKGPGWHTLNQTRFGDIRVMSTTDDHWKLVRGHHQEGDVLLRTGEWVPVPSVSISLVNDMHRWSFKIKEVIKKLEDLAQADS